MSLTLSPLRRVAAYTYYAYDYGYHDRRGNEQKGEGGRVHGYRVKQK